MTQHPTPGADDEPLARRIATLMRHGTVYACILLIIGALLAILRPGTATTALLTAGCTLLVLLPMIRLAMMTWHFARLTQKHFAVASVAVLALVIAGGVVGIAI